MSKRRNMGKEGRKDLEEGCKERRKERKNGKGGKKEKMRKEGRRKKCERREERTRRQAVKKGPRASPGSVLTLAISRP